MNGIYDQIKDFVKERDAAAKSYDVNVFREFYYKWRIEGAFCIDLPIDDKVVEIMMRKMVYHAQSSTRQEKKQAKTWLFEHGCTTDI